MFDKGSGLPLVVIPGVQGRWEWMRPALRALARRCRTISYSLPRVDDFDQFVATVDATQMAKRIELKPGPDLCADCARVTAATLVITGEDALDTVVPVASTAEYARLIPGARHETMDHTGHLGLITQPERFARIV